MMQTTENLNDMKFDYSQAEPLDWCQMRTLLWDGVDKVSEAEPNRWEKIADLINEHCVHSQPQTAQTYESVFQKIFSNYAQTNDGEATPSGCKIWTKILYETTRDIFKPTPIFLNLGFVELNSDGESLPLSGDDEMYRLAIQLYHHVLGDADIAGKSILEVGCGNGGGASYVVRTRRPASYVGIDLLPGHIEMCLKSHDQPGLSFQIGDAEKLPFEDESFDGVINVESSHSYNSMESFLSEVKRVLKPQGHFWFTDLRPTTDEWGENRNLAALERQIADSGLKIVKRTNIRDNVLAAMDTLEDAKQMFMDMNEVSGANRRHFEEIMLCRNSHNYKKLKNREWEYVHFVLSK